MSRIDRLPRATPESQGVTSSALLGFIDALDTRLRHPHGVMVLRRGHVIAEGWWAPYRPHERHALFSLSKSFTATAIGLLVEEGRLSLDDRVVDLLPDDAPATVDARLGRMLVRHLLSMSTGHELDGLESVPETGGWARHLLAQPVTHEPGTRFMYETGATYLLSAIVTRLTGERLLEYLGPRLLAPLGIEGATWDRSPDGIDTGGYGLSATTEDIAAFGQLLLQRGVWQRRQLVPASWVAAASARQVDNGDPAAASDWTQGYGYQMWRSRHGAFRGDGAFGQLCVVMPEQEVVVAVTAGLPDMQVEMDVLWEELLPAIGRDSPVAPDPEAHVRLTARLAALSLPLPEDSAMSPRASRVSRVRYRVAGDDGLDTLTLTARADRIDLELTWPGAEARVGCGFGCWLPGRLELTGGAVKPGDPPAGPLAGAAAWVSDDRVEAHLWSVRTAFGWLLQATFGDDGTVRVELRQNVAFGPPPVIRATGSAERPS